MSTDNEQGDLKSPYKGTSDPTGSTPEDLDSLLTLLTDKRPTTRSFGRLVATGALQNIVNWFHAETEDDETWADPTPMIALARLAGACLALCTMKTAPAGEPPLPTCVALFDQFNEMVKRDAIALYTDKHPTHELR